MTHKKTEYLRGQIFQAWEQLLTSSHTEVLLFWQISNCQTQPFVKGNGKREKRNSVHFFSLLNICIKPAILNHCKLSVQPSMAHSLSYYFTPKNCYPMNLLKRPNAKGDKISFWLITFETFSINSFLSIT
jgi:hypothetical protein